MIFKKFIDLLSNSYTNNTNFEENDKKYIYIRPEMMDLYANYTSFQLIKDHISENFDEIHEKLSKNYKDLEIFIGKSNSFRYFDQKMNELMIFSILDRKDIENSSKLYEITRLLHYDNYYNIHFLCYTDNKSEFDAQFEFYKEKMSNFEEKIPNFKDFYRSYWYYDEFTVIGLTNLNSGLKTAIDIRISDEYPFTPLEKKVNEVLNDLIKKEIIEDKFIYLEKMCKNNSI